MTTNKELIKDEVKYMLSNLRNSIAYGGRDTCVVYLANVRKETIATIEGMGIKHEQAGRWGHRLFAPKKGTKAYKTLFDGSKVLEEAKAYKEAKVAAAKAEKAEKEKKAKERAAAKAAKEKATKDKAEKKAAAPKAAKAEKKAAAPKAAKAEKKTAAPKAEKKAKVEKKPTTKKAAAPKAKKPATPKVETPAAPKAEETKTEA